MATRATLAAMGTTHFLEDEVLLIKVTGPWTVEVANALRSTVTPYFWQQGVRSLLLDLREAIINVTTLDIHDVTSAHATSFPPGTRHAVIIQPEFASGADGRFGENVAFNRCVQMRLFADEESARQWLREGSQT